MSSTALTGVCLSKNYGAAGILDGGENHQGGRFVQMLDNCLVDNFRDKPQGALGSDHQVDQDIERIVVIHECIEAVAGGILNLEFVADAGGQCRIGADRVGQAGEIVQHLAVAGGKIVPAAVIGGVEQSAVGKDHPHAVDGLIAVLGRSAAHPAGIVGGDTADHGSVDGGRIGADLFSERRQQPVGLGADNARLQKDFGAVVQDPVIGPVVSGYQQDGVCNRLAGQAGTCRPESDRQLHCVGRLEDADHFSLCFGFDDHPGNEAVKAGIRPIGKGSKGIANNAIL
jgi:hypothetical protein